ncbi:malonyl-CoA decarboxylase [Shimia sp. MIT910701]|uniref:malonyl-CoA decarboxylase n=1 Tax=Shimia sp. MIT910701 TaxID=3096987 RepID=UPI00399C0C83
MAKPTSVSDFLAGLLDLRKSSNDLDDRSIAELCEALLSTEGQVSGRRIAAALLARYQSMDEAGKHAFFTHLNDAWDVAPAQIKELAAQYDEAPTPENFAALVTAAEPRRQELFRRLNQAEGATAALVQMRVDLLDYVRDDPNLRRTDLDLVHLLTSWFNRGFLVLRQITWSTPANILEKIVAYEAVHEIKDWEDLRRRLHPEDRRCFAFFHPAMPEDPLIFVEVALTKDIPGSIQNVLAEDRETLDIDAARTAVFYSISNCQQGLAGISFGNLLIKQVASELSTQLPHLKTFVTLSPIPLLRKWQAQQSLETLPVDTDLAAHYLLNARREDGFPYDPVARFHLGNGALIHAVHEEADTTDKGKAQSGGVMVNYLYDLSQTERNHESFALNHTIAASRALQQKARSMGQRLNTQKTETSK